MSAVQRTGCAWLPSLDRLLESETGRALSARHGRPLVTETARAALAYQRSLLALDSQAACPAEEALLRECAVRLDEFAKPSLRPVFNLTGTVLHTNLGRALYPEAAIDAATAAMRGPVNLEYDIEGAGRGERDSYVESLLTRLTGAEAALSVNNNASAVYLALNTLANGKEVIVSRGELVEIGGSFRVPDIMASSGCVLREVGTANRTHPADYERAIGEASGAVMKVHASNYEIRGFTCSVGEAELSQIARGHGLPFINDLGCGTLVDLEIWGLPHEPTPREAIAQGADVVTFSGDKLLGGPQCGIVVGRKGLIDRLRKNPMKRALRLDKVRLAALESVLRLYFDPQRLSQSLPTLRLLTRPQSDIRAQAQRVLGPISAALAGQAQSSVVDCASQVGSGALPVDMLPSCGIALVSQAVGKGGGADALAELFRRLPIPVIGHIHAGSLIFDLRCLQDEEGFVAQLRELGHERFSHGRTPQ